MRASWRWVVGLSLWVPPFIACGSKSSGFADPVNEGSATSGNDGGDGSAAVVVSSSGGGGQGLFQVPDALPPATMVADSACKAGFYQGGFTGNYASSLLLGIPLTVTGNVELTLNQEGSSTQTCKVTENGEFAMESCNNVFTLSGGTITGVANEAAMIGDAAIGGYPYFCTMTGTLDCVKKKLVNGWIQCTYCVGPLADGGSSCALGGGGHFAGPVTANYDTGTLAFTDGTWNGAEALAGNDGGSPGPDGGPISDYLALDGGYSFLGKYGGSGDWNATCLDCRD
jgi:hypothetical protein